MHTGTITLALTVHEPDGRLLSLLEGQMPALLTRYSALAAYCSPRTQPAILDFLRGGGAAVRVAEEEQGGILGIGQARRRALGLALEASTSHIQLCDFDRALHWAARYGAEMDQVAHNLHHYDLLILGRTHRAWSTHPAYQTETESLFNRVFFLATKLPWDIGAGSRGVSREAAEHLLTMSTDLTVGVDAEWPLLLMRANAGAESEFRLGYRACEGLEFETADRFGPEIDAAGSYAAWLARLESDPQHWAFRLQVAHLIAAAVARHSASP